MTAREQRRAWVLAKVLKRERTMAEAAAALELSERQLWRLRAAFERDGPAGVVHGNRSRASHRRLDEREARYAYSGRTVEDHLRLDRSLIAYDGRRQLALTPAPIAPRQLRAHGADRAGPSLEPAPATLP